MRNKILFILTVILFFLFLTPTKITAETKHARESAKLVTSEIELKEDRRAEALEAFLRQYNSPFADKADVFVSAADKHNLDWKFVAAISGIESTFGQHYPQGTYNAWGWGIYGDNMHYFTSWDDAIETISRELRTKYMDTWGAQNVYEIGNHYAASPTWAARVTNFMNQIETYSNEYENTQLSLTL